MTSPDEARERLNIELHKRCEYADERTMPPLPVEGERSPIFPERNDLERLEAWANDLCSTHERGDLGRMVVSLILHARSLAREVEALRGVVEAAREVWNPDGESSEYFSQPPYVERDVK